MKKKVNHEEIIRVLATIAPPGLAEDWDNVGLLVEPGGKIPVTRVLLAVDLTEPVLDEAIQGKFQLVIAYHPPLFSALKRLRWEVPGERVMLRAIKAGILIYSPHTALDAQAGGVNDWLAAGLGEGTCTPLAPVRASQEFKVVTFVPPAAVETVRQALAEKGAGSIGDYSQCSFGVTGKGSFLGGGGSQPVVGRRGRLEQAEEVRLEMVCPAASLAGVGEALAAAHPYEEPAWDVYPLERKCLPGTGQGREVVLAKPVGLSALTRRVKRYLGTGNLQVAAAPEHLSGAKVERIAICAGAGGSLFGGIDGPQVFLTGEMSHHDVLAKVARGSSVILCGHTETERGYLPVLGEHLSRKLGDRVQVFLSEADHPPLVKG